MNKTTFPDSHAFRSQLRSNNAIDKSRDRSSPEQKTTSSVTPNRSEGQPLTSASNANMEKMAVQMVSKWFMKNISALTGRRLNMANQPAKRQESRGRQVPGSSRGSSSSSNSGLEFESPLEDVENPPSFGSTGSIAPTSQQ